MYYFLVWYATLLRPGHTVAQGQTDMLRVWFSCPFVPSEHVMNMTVPREVCTKDKQHARVRFWCLKEWEGQTSVDNSLPTMDRTVCYNEACVSGSKCLKAAEVVLLMQTFKDAHSRPQTKKTWRVLQLQLNHTRTTSPCDLDLQYDQASAVLPITQRKCSSIALTFLILLVHKNGSLAHLNCINWFIRINHSYFGHCCSWRRSVTGITKRPCA
jgi:hypothetical protein